MITDVWKGQVRKNNLTNLSLADHHSSGVKHWFWKQCSLSGLVNVTVNAHTIRTQIREHGWCYLWLNAYTTVCGFGTQQATKTVSDFCLFTNSFNLQGIYLEKYECAQNCPSCTTEIELCAFLKCYVPKLSRSKHARVNKKCCGILSSFHLVGFCIMRCWWYSPIVGIVVTISPSFSL